tara:strand:- start:9378 stop:9791 length:414 start_codon:yes stop_codon:yes gene_type:complete
MGDLYDCGISIKLKYFPENNWEKRFPMPFEVFAGVDSEITFPRDILDFKNKGNRTLYLGVVPSWRQGVSWFARLDGMPYNIASVFFERLEGSLDNCSEELFKRWQENAERVYNDAERKLLELYKEGRNIPKDFFGFV